MLRAVLRGTVDRVRQGPRERRSSSPRQMGYNDGAARYDTGESVLPVTGSSDFELEGDLCECKSVGANAWAGVLAAVHSDGGTKCADGYLASYWRQLQLYMNLGGYVRGILLFSNRDRVAMAQEEHEVNRYWFDAAMESAGRIRWLCAPVIALLRDGAEPDSMEVQAHSASRQRVLL